MFYLYLLIRENFLVKVFPKTFLMHCYFFFVFLSFEPLSTVSLMSRCLLIFINFVLRLWCTRRTWGFQQIHCGIWHDSRLYQMGRIIRFSTMACHYWWQSRYQDISLDYRQWRRESSCSFFQCLDGMLHKMLGEKMRFEAFCWHRKHVKVQASPTGDTS